MSEKINASMLYNLVHCPHRVTLDLFGNYAERDPISPFVQLLWEKGHAFELEVVNKLEIPYTNLREFKDKEKEIFTRKAIERGDDLIYSGRICAEDLVGEPDILRRNGKKYTVGDIKSGAGFEGVNEDSDGKPKKHYAVQLALYNDILEKLDLSEERRPFIWDINGDEIEYDLNAPQGVRIKDSLWDFYKTCLASAKSISSNSKETLPALSSTCKLCHWRTVCKKQLEKSEDLTLLPELGRSKRDTMLTHIATVTELANTDINGLITGKKTVFPGIGIDTIKKFKARAELQINPNARPYIKKPIVFPENDLEIFFDIETDPMRDICYLHGFIERRARDEKTEKYISFFAKDASQEEEEKVFKDALEYVQKSVSGVIYYYSQYEPTIWRKLQKKYPSVAAEEQINGIFEKDKAVDLYQHVVRPCTEWPTYDQSIKTLASYLGFKWRDTDPSGAASIEWFHRWIETGDSEIRDRILKYNEDDCRATRVLLDGIKNLGG